MKQYFICLDCIETKTGKPVHDLPIDLFNQIRREMAFAGPVCPLCGGDRTRKVFGIETSYIRGYGFTDKAGVKRDMDLHAMMTGQDPYKEHRKMGEARDVITNLQRDREHHTNSKTVYMSK